MEISDQRHTLSDPRWFVSDVDVANRLVQFIHVDEDKLRSAAFHDGRAEIATQPLQARVLSFEDACAAAAEADPLARAPSRLIMHVAFCGSTLLARLLDAPGATTCYREPQALVHLAREAANPGVDWRAGDCAGVLDVVLGKLTTPFAGAGAALVKPSNWANGLAPVLAERAADVRLVMIDLPLEDFLLAHVRGGHERIRLSLDLLNLLVQSRAGDRATALEIQSSDLAHFQKLLRLLGLLLDIQRRLLRQAARAAERILVQTKSDILADPFAAASRARDVLDIDVDDRLIAQNCARFDGRSAKSPRGERFRPADEQTLNQALRDRFGAEFEDALAWAERGAASALQAS